MVGRPTFLLAAALMLRVACATGAEHADWPMFGHDPQHTGASACNFASSDLRRAWRFKPGAHVWSYERETAVWSSPVVASVGDKTLLFVGSYDRNVYALNAATGKVVWRFTTGGPVSSTPAVARVGGRMCVFAASAGRTIYALDAASGEQVWAHETFAWGYTVAPSKMSSIVVAEVAGEPAVFLGVWNNKRSGFRNVQRGEVLALDAKTGRKRWGQVLGSSFVTTPAVAKVDGAEALLVATYDGKLYSLDLASGARRWAATTNERVFSSPSVALAGGRTLMLIGTRFHSLYAFDAATGKRVWRYQAGYWFDSTPAIARVGTRWMALAGSYDRSFYAVDALTGARVWRLTAGNAMHSSAAVCTIAGKPAVFAASLDDHVYAMDGASGKVLWKHATGAFLWSHMERGDTLWASPAVANVARRAMLFVASYDGYLYAFASGRS